MKRVLVVEDTEAIRALYRIHLRPRFEVVEAEDGERAIASCVYHKFEFALIIIDQSMPRLTGLDVIRLIRQKSPVFMPLVLISAYADDDLRMAAFAAGANEVMNKPVRFNDFKAMLERFVPTVREIVP